LAQGSLEPKKVGPKTKKAGIEGIEHKPTVTEVLHHRSAAILGRRKYPTGLKGRDW